MPLSAGTRLGPYEIVAPIGAGGMGEVYRAKDTKLKREVALKVLPDSFARDPERMARFQREAEVLASLNHPKIAQIYGVEERALVMELVPGESLKGPLPLETALDYAKQIADALEAAHDKGIIHRDLKPANIMVTHEGVVKVLDFGLAAVASRNRDAADPSNSPTMTIAATQAGMIMGTAAYMSPEQAAGKPVDKRADIWAFGVVLYEMLAGKRLFEGETISDTLAAVLKTKPDLTQVPAKVRRLLEGCLEKDPRRRLRDIGDVGLLLEEGEPATTAPSRSRLGITGWVAAGVFALIAVALAVLYFRQKPPETPVVRATILPPEKTILPFYGVPSVSPDGRRLVLPAVSEDGVYRLWLRSLDSTTSQPLAGTEAASGSTYPFWSSDGRSVGFNSDGQLKKIDLSGGPAVTLAEVINFRGASWSPQGVIVFAANTTGPLQRIAAAGGIATPATALDPARKENSHRWPWFLPDGRHFLYATTVNPSNDATIYVGSLDSREARIVAQANSNAVYGSGHLLFLRKNTLMAQPFDAKRLTTTGEAVPVAEQIADQARRARGLFTVSDNGMLIFQSDVPFLKMLVWLDRTGKRLATVGEPGQLNQTFLSPDSKSAIVSIYDRGGHNLDLWIYDLARNLRSRFTFDPSDKNQGIWSPDGSQIVFGSNGKGHFDLYRKLAGGEGAEELLYADGLNKFPTSWSPDGKFVLYFSAGDLKSDLWVLPLAGDRKRKPFPLLKTNFNEALGQFSPDGRWVAYTSDESGRGEIYVAPFPGSGGKRQVSLAGGDAARWRADGKELFYVAPDERLMATEVNIKGAEVEIGAARPLFGPLQPGSYYPYDVSPDGQRFLLTIRSEQAGTAWLTLVQNWAAGLTK
jgi:eukaryotic-like serine/threonine-protein kinase